MLVRGGTMAEDVFAQRLNEAMAARGAKQVDVLHAAQKQGRKLGKSQLSQYVSGKTTPRADTMALLAELLGVDAAWLSGASNAGGAQGTVAAEATAGGASTSDAGANAAQADEPSRTARARSHSNSKRAAATSCSNPTSNTETTTPSSAPTPSPDSPKGTPMRTFSKSSKLDNVLYDVRGPVVDEANRMEASGTHVLKLNIGNPATFGLPHARRGGAGHGAPAHRVRGLLGKPRPVLGAQGDHAVLAAQRPAQRHHGRRLHGQRRERAHQPVHAGAAGHRRRDPDPHARLPAVDGVRNAGGRQGGPLRCDEEANWFPDVDDIRKKITPNTKAIVIINPNNPTGAVYSREVLEEIVQVARENQLIIFSDEIYDRLIMDG
jgi:alanine-synthesizing transaminase